MHRRARTSALRATIMSGARSRNHRPVRRKRTTRLPPKPGRDRTPGGDARRTGVGGEPRTRRDRGGVADNGAVDQRRKTLLGTASRRSTSGLTMAGRPRSGSRCIGWPKRWRNHSRDRTRSKQSGESGGSTKLRSPTTGIPSERLRGQCAHWSQSRARRIQCRDAREAERLNATTNDVRWTAHAWSSTAYSRGEPSRAGTDQLAERSAVVAVRSGARSEGYPAHAAHRALHQRAVGAEHP